MLDVETLMTTLYVMLDDFIKTLPALRRRGPSPKLARAEVVTLGVLGQWYRFRSERDFYDWAQRHLRAAFPTLPDRSQFNRQLRSEQDLITGLGLHLVELLSARQCTHEILDGTAVPVRNVKRRGTGWLAGQANIGHSNRLGWYHGFHLMLAVTPEGVITGHGLAPASTNERPYTETFLGARALPHPRLPGVGAPALGPYVVDKGFVGRAHHKRWRDLYGAQIICVPTRAARKDSPQPWPKPLRRFVSSVRQVVESVNNVLHNVFRLDRERPHDLTGVQTRVAAKVALHNFCVWLNVQMGRPPLAMAGLLDW